MSARANATTDLDLALMAATAIDREATYEARALAVTNLFCELVRARARLDIADGLRRVREAQHDGRTCAACANVVDLSARFRPSMPHSDACLADAAADGLRRVCEMRHSHPTTCAACANVLDVTSRLNLSLRHVDGCLAAERAP